MSTGKAPEKSSFSRRCSLLSRYLKEKGSFGNIDIGLARKLDLELTGKSDRGQKNEIKKADISETRTFDLTQNVSVGEAFISSGGKSRYVDLTLSEPASVVPEPGNSQLTIFFRGKVMVYDEFPEDKAKEIMEAAKKASHVVAVDSKKTQNLDMNVCNKSNVVIPDLNEPTSSGTNNDDHGTGEQNQVVERIARRASLHRFFAKRKDRAVARAPYQVNQNCGHLPPKPQKVVGSSVEPGQPSGQPSTPSKPKRHNDVSMEVDGEGRCSKDLELKL